MALRGRAQPPPRARAPAVARVEETSAVAARGVAAGAESAGASSTGGALACVAGDRLPVSARATASGSSPPGFSFCLSWPSLTAFGLSAALAAGFRSLSRLASSSSLFSRFASPSRSSRLPRSAMPCVGAASATVLAAFESAPCDGVGTGCAAAAVTAAVVVAVVVVAMVVVAVVVVAVVVVAAAVVVASSAVVVGAAGVAAAAVVVASVVVVVVVVPVLAVVSVVVFSLVVVERCGAAGGPCRSPSPPRARAANASVALAHTRQVRTPTERGPKRGVLLAVGRTLFTDRPWS